MSEDRETLPPRPKSEEKSKGRLLDWLDAIAKLVGAAAVLAVALIVNSYWGDRRNRVLQSVAGVFNDSAPAKKVMIPTSSCESAWNHYRAAQTRNPGTSIAALAW